MPLSCVQVRIFHFRNPNLALRKPHDALLNGRFARSCLSPKECGRDSLVCRVFCEGLSGDDLLWRRHLEDDYAQLEGPTGPNGALASYRQAAEGTLVHCAMRHAVHSARTAWGFCSRHFRGPLHAGSLDATRKGRGLCAWPHIHWGGRLLDSIMRYWSMADPLLLRPPIVAPHAPPEGAACDVPCRHAYREWATSFRLEPAAMVRRAVVAWRSIEVSAPCPLLPMAPMVRHPPIVGTYRPPPPAYGAC